MTLRDRWKAVPPDAWMGYLTTVGFALWLTLCVVGGPAAFFLAPWFLVYPLMAAVVLVLAFKFVIRTGRVRRVLPLLLTFVCLATFWVSPWATICMDLHLIARVYLAGGADNLSEWAQGLIRERDGRANDPPFIEPERIPTGVRSHLPGYVIVGGTLWSDLVRLRIELGGGFYHYGVEVYPRTVALALAPEWWQRIIRWPPEVVIYHE